MPKKPAPQDPFAAREAEKYEKPIPSREFILEALEKASGPMTHAQLCALLELGDQVGGAPEAESDLHTRVVGLELLADLLEARGE